MDRLELIRQNLSPINDALPVLLPQARERSLNAMDTLHTPREKYPKLYADSLNATLRSEIADDPIDGWKLAGATHCLHLRNVDTGLKLRFLKEFRFEGAVPPAGTNHRRREAWAQPAILDQEAFGGKPLEDAEIILVWTESNSVFHCSAYLPVGPGKFPKGAPCIALMVLPMEGDLKEMSFNGEDADGELLVPKTNTIIQERKEETVQ